MHVPTVSFFTLTYKTIQHGFTWRHKVQYNTHGDALMYFTGIHYSECFSPPTKLQQTII